ncbi:MAG: 23S rRNA (adenine(2503)-C(2))-methyltransferase RlmN [Phycisphaerales bacterium]|nr:23S rRNA (adenine(2503)-C(2))-methyltransferase RlmN [Phycisphaerales bacterium]
MPSPSPPTLRNPALHIFDLTRDDLRRWCEDVGMPAYRATQIHEWVYTRGIADPALMSNLSRRDRELLADPERGITFISGQTVAHQKASDGTQKLLIEWASASGVGCRMSDDETEARGRSLPVLSSHPTSDIPSPTSRQTECVMIPYGEDTFDHVGRGGGDDERDGYDGSPGRPPLKARRTACISSQVGCPVGCKFCASGIGGLDGNLSAGRIVEQVWRLQQVLGSGLAPQVPGPRPSHPPSDTRHPPSPRITNVVFMGMGEPLANFANVTRAIRTLNAAPPHGMGIGARKITVSTVGLPKAIERLAAELDIPVTLALSLHAPNDTIRRELIPWAEYTTIPDLLAACQKWFERSGREITLEYIMLGGVNDRPEHARELSRIARTLRANINLIRYNEVVFPGGGTPFSRPEDADVREFQRILREAGVNTHIRASRGRDIAAACGQLRHEKAGTA